MGKKILITGDVYSIIEKEDSFLKRDDVTVMSPVSKDEIVGIHMNEHVDLIVFGMDAPGMTADQLCSLIRDDPEMRKVSIIAVTSEVRLSDEKGPECGANEIMTSPFSPGSLLNRMFSFLDISERADLRAPLGIKVNSAGKKETFVCYSENISASGMLIQADNDLNIGDEIACGFYLPDNTHIKAVAVVVRHAEKHKGFKSGKYGIKFTDVNEDMKAAIDRFVRGLTPER